MNEMYARFSKGERTVCVTCTNFFCLNFYGILAFVFALAVCRVCFAKKFSLKVRNACNNVTDVKNFFLPEQSTLLFFHGPFHC